MTEPAQHIGDALRSRPLGQLRPRDHDDGQAEHAGGIDLGARARAAGVAGNDPSDMTRLHRLQFICEHERSARYGDVGLGKRRRAIGWIDEAQHIGVLRLCTKGRDVLPANGEKHARRFVGKRGDGGADIRYFDPVVAGPFRPWRAFEREQRSSGCRAGRNGIAAHRGGERMGRIDDMRDVFLTNISGESARAAEAADANWQRLARGRAGAAAIGIDRIASGTCDSFREQVCVARSAQNEGARHG